MRVCVVGAGFGGLVAAKNCLQFNLEVVVFEIAKDVGGTWIYTDDTGKDEFGLEIHTSMYRGLQ